MPIRHIYHVPSNVSEVSERNGVSIETVISVVTFIRGPIRYRDDIERELGISHSQSRELMRSWRLPEQRTWQDRREQRMERRTDVVLRVALPPDVQNALFDMACQSGTRFYRPKVLFEHIASVLAKH